MSDEPIEQTSKRLAEVETLQQTLASVQQELRTYQDLLSQKLALLREEQEVVRLPIADDDWGDLPEPAPAAVEPPKAVPLAAPEPAKGTPVPPAKPAIGIPVRAAAAPVAPAPPQRPAAKDTIHTKAPVPQPRADAARGERRTAPRRGGNPISVQITNPDSGEALQGWVVDRSSGGVRLMVDQAIDNGTLLSLRPTKAHPSLGWIDVRVKSCRPDRNSFKLHCEFVNKLSWAELQVFG